MLWLYLSILYVVCQDERDIFCVEKYKLNEISTVSFFGRFVTNAIIIGILTTGALTIILLILTPIIVFGILLTVVSIAAVAFAIVL